MTTEDRAKAFWQDEYHSDYATWDLMAAFANAEKAELLADLRRKVEAMQGFYRGGDDVLYVDLADVKAMFEEVADEN